MPINLLSPTPTMQKQIVALDLSKDLLLKWANHVFGWEGQTRVANEIFPASALIAEGNVGVIMEIPFDELETFIKSIVKCKLPYEFYSPHYKIAVAECPLNGHNFFERGVYPQFINGTNANTFERETKLAITAAVKTWPTDKQVHVMALVAVPNPSYVRRMETINAIESILNVHSVMKDTEDAVMYKYNYLKNYGIDFDTDMIRIKHCVSSGAKIHKSIDYHDMVLSILADVNRWRNNVLHTPPVINLDEIFAPQIKQLTIMGMRVESKGMQQIIDDIQNENHADEVNVKELAKQRFDFLLCYNGQVKCTYILRSDDETVADRYENVWSGAFDKLKENSFIEMNGYTPVFKECARDRAIAQSLTPSFPNPNPNPTPQGEI